MRNDAGDGQGDGQGDGWVFGYGSLMWRPGFRFLACVPATLQGYRRCFCIYSHYYRGTPQQPGLVLGLAPGGTCRGLAFRVAAAELPGVRAYLDERELLSYAYTGVELPVETAQGTVVAYTFVADPTHPHYAGELPVEQSADIIVEASGRAGLNRDYLIETVRRLEAEGYQDPALHVLLRAVELRTGVLDAGGGI